VSEHPYSSMRDARFAKVPATKMKQRMVVKVDDDSSLVHDLGNVLNGQKGHFVPEVVEEHHRVALGTDTNEDLSFGPGLTGCSALPKCGLGVQVQQGRRSSAPC